MPDFAAISFARDLPISPPTTAPVPPPSLLPNSVPAAPPKSATLEVTKPPTVREIPVVASVITCGALGLIVAPFIMFCRVLVIAVSGVTGSPTIRSEFVPGKIYN